MTLFWIFAAILTAAVVAAMVWPLMRRPTTFTERSRYDLAVYRDQLAEIDRDHAQGAIDTGQAEAARLEVSRRILTASAGQTDPTPVVAGRANRVAALTLMTGLPLAALALYLTLGRPDLPDQPLAARQAAFAADATPTQAASPEVLAAVAHLEQHLKAEPNNLEGWVLLAQSLNKLGRLSQATEAWHRAATLAPNDIEIMGNLAEALTAANQDQVPDEARRLFEAMLAKQPGDPRAAHYLALARAQSGDYKDALARWVALAAASPANAPWLPLVQDRIEDMARRLNLDGATVMPKPLPATAATPSSTNGQPDDKTEAIRAMVEKLATRLDANSGDVPGWLRLARAYQVLGDADKEMAALKRARSQAPRDADVLVAYAGAVLTQHPPGDTDPLPAEVVEALSTALETAPNSQAALWYLGIDAANRNQTAKARTLWERLLATLAPTSPDYAEVKARLAAFK